MEIHPLSQLIQALSSVLFGAVLGLLYDILRALRRTLGVKNTPADLIFCLGTLSSLFYLGMSLGNGQLRIFMALFCAIGCALYLSCVTPFLLPLLIRLLELLCIPVRLLKKTVKKIAVFSKKHFTYPKKWFRIKHNIDALPARENPRNIFLSGEEYSHGTQNRYDGKTAATVSHSLCSAEFDLTHRRAAQRTKRPRRRRR